MVSLSLSVQQQKTHLALNYRFTISFKLFFIEFGFALIYTVMVIYSESITKGKQADLRTEET